MGLLVLVACGSNDFVAVEAVNPAKAPRPAPDSGDPEDSPVPEDSPPPSDEPLELCINELMSQNVNSVADENGVPSDWIELHNPGAEPVDLAGWSIGRDEDVDALDGLTIEAGGFLLLWADENTVAAGQHLDFDLPGDGGTLELLAPDGRGTELAFGSMEADWSASRATDCAVDAWEFVWHGTPGSTNFIPVYMELPLLDAGSSWRWLDTGVDPDPAWTLLGFDDSPWPEGAAPLGYGDTWLLTTVSYGADPNNKFITTWFRRVFTAYDIGLFHELTLSLLRDDGAIVYLNGTEVVRSNMPEGEVTSATPALASTETETAYWGYSVDPALLLEGDNQLAVELHQAGATSSDLGFDLSLSASVPEP